MVKIKAKKVCRGEGEMIVSDANHGQEGQYVSFQMPDGSSQRGTLVLAHDGNGENQGQEGYIVVTAQEDDKGNFSLQQTEATHEHEPEHEHEHEPEPEPVEQKVAILQKTQENDGLDEEQG